MQVPSLGRIVHYIAWNGEVLPAMVVAIHPDNVLNLQVFKDSHDGLEWVNRVYNTPSVDGVPEFGPGTWFWPPRR